MAKTTKENGFLKKTVNSPYFIFGGGAAAVGALLYYINTGDESAIVETAQEFSNIQAEPIIDAAGNASEITSTFDLLDSLKEQIDSGREAADLNGETLNEFLPEDLEADFATSETPEVATVTEPDIAENVSSPAGSEICSEPLGEAVSAMVNPGCGGAIQMFRDLGGNLVSHLREAGYFDSEIQSFFAEGSPMDQLVEAQLTGDRDIINEAAQNVARQTGFYHPEADLIDPSGQESFTILRGASFTVQPDGSLVFNQPGGAAHTIFDCDGLHDGPQGNWRNTVPCHDTVIADPFADARPTMRPEFDTETVVQNPEPQVLVTQEIVNLPPEVQQQPPLPVEVSSPLVNVQLQQISDVCLTNNNVCSAAGPDGYLNTFIFSAENIDHGTTEAEIARLMQRPEIDVNYGLVYELNANGEPTGALKCVELIGRGEHARVEYSPFVRGSESAPYIAPQGRFESTYNPRWVMRDDIVPYLNGTFGTHDGVLHPDNPTEVLIGDDHIAYIYETPAQQERLIVNDIFSDSRLSEAEMLMRWEAIKEIELPNASEVTTGYFENQGLRTTEARDLAEWIRGLSGQEGGPSSLLKERTHRIFAESATTPLGNHQTIGDYLEEAIPHYTNAVNSMYPVRGT